MQKHAEKPGDSKVEPGNSGIPLKCISRSLVSLQRKEHQDPGREFCIRRACSRNCEDLATIATPRLCNSGALTLKALPSKSARSHNRKSILLGGGKGTSYSEAFLDSEVLSERPAEDPNSQLVPAGPVQELLPWQAHSQRLKDWHICTSFPIAADGLSALRFHLLGPRSATARSGRSGAGEAED